MDYLNHSDADDKQNVYLANEENFLSGAQKREALRIRALPGLRGSYLLPETFQFTPTPPSTDARGLVPVKRRPSLLNPVVLDSKRFKTEDSEKCIKGDMSHPLLQEHKDSCPIINSLSATNSTKHREVKDIFKVEHYDSCIPVTDLGNGLAEMSIKMQFSYDSTDMNSDEKEASVTNITKTALMKALSKYIKHEHGDDSEDGGGEEDADAKIRELEETAYEAENRASEITKQIVAMDAQLEQKENIILEKDEVITTLKEELDDTMYMLRKKRNLLEKKEELLVVLREKNEQVQADLDKNMTRNKNLLDLKEKIILVLSKKLNDSKCEVTGLQNELERKTGEISDLESKIVELQMEIQSKEAVIRQERHDVDEKLKLVENEIHTKNGKIKELEQNALHSNEIHASEREAFKSNCLKFEQQLRVKDSEVLSLATQVKQISSSKEKQDFELERVMSNMTYVEGQLSKSQLKLSEKDELIAKMEKEKTEVHAREISVKEEEIRKKDAEIKRLVEKQMIEKVEMEKSETLLQELYVKDEEINQKDAEIIWLKKELRDCMSDFKTTEYSEKADGFNSAEKEDREEQVLEVLAKDINCKEKNSLKFPDGINDLKEEEAESDHKLHKFIKNFEKWYASKVISAILPSTDSAVKDKGVQTLDFHDSEVFLFSSDEEERAGQDAIVASDESIMEVNKNHTKVKILGEKVKSCMGELKSIKREVKKRDVTIKSLSLKLQKSSKKCCKQKKAIENNRKIIDRLQEKDTFSEEKNLELRKSLEECEKKCCIFQKEISSLTEMVKSRKEATCMMEERKIRSLSNAVAKLKIKKLTDRLSSCKSKLRTRKADIAILKKHLKAEKTKSDQHKQTLKENVKKIAENEGVIEALQYQLYEERRKQPHFSDWENLIMKVNGVKKEIADKLFLVQQMLNRVENTQRIHHEPLKLAKVEAESAVTKLVTRLQKCTHKNLTTIR